MGKAARFVTSLRMRLKTKGREQNGVDVQTQRRSGIVSWFSTSDLDHVDQHADFLLDDSGLDVTPSPTSPQSFMTSLINRLKVRSSRKKTNSDVQNKRRSGVMSWFSTSDLDHIEDSTYLLDDSGLGVTSGPSTPARRNRDSGYVGRFSGHEDVRRSWILEDKVCLDLERGEVTPCFALQERETISKADSVSSLLRCTSIQDKSLKVTRKRRQNVVKRNRRNKYASFKKAIFPDEGIDVESGDCTTDDSCDELLTPPSEKKSSPIEVGETMKGPEGVAPVVARATGNPRDIVPFEAKVTRTPEGIARQNSVQKKSWEIRRRRKQEFQKKRRSANLEVCLAARAELEENVSDP